MKHFLLNLEDGLVVYPANAIDFCLQGGYGFTGLADTTTLDKKRTILKIRGEKNAVPHVISCSIRRDQRRAKVADSRGSDLPCADRAWSSMISHVEQRSSRRESQWWFLFFLSRVVVLLCMCISDFITSRGCNSKSIVCLSQLVLIWRLQSATAQKACIFPRVDQWFERSRSNNFYWLLVEYFLPSLSDCIHSSSVARQRESQPPHCRHGNHAQHTTTHTCWPYLQTNKLQDSGNPRQLWRRNCMPDNKQEWPYASRVGDWAA